MSSIFFAPNPWGGMLADRAMFRFSCARYLWMHDGILARLLFGISQQLRHVKPTSPKKKPVS
eukprot:12441005-Alexandrium_andersonii.AAC.1